MDDNTKKEEFSYGYIQMLAAISGYSFINSPRSLDHGGIDAMKTLPLERFESIFPERFIQYLENNNWQKHKEVADVLSIWVYERDEEKFGLLLPLDSELVDFSKRMAEAVGVLEEVEQISQEEILLALEAPSRIALEKKREILNIKISSFLDKGKREVPAKNLGLVFKSLQELLDIFGGFKPSRYSSLNQTKKKLELSVLGTFKGSFGVQVAFPPNQQFDIHGKTLAEEVSQEFFNLMKASNAKNVDQFKAILSEYKGDPSKKIKSFFSELAKLESDLNFDWGATNPENSDRANLDYANILRALEIIKKIELEEPRQFKIVGRLIVAGEGVKKKERKFLIKDIEDSTEYEGAINAKITEDDSIDLIIGKVYEATLEEETKIQEVTQTEIKNYTLVELKLKTAK
ncbi:MULTISPECIES: hypothetical protein [Spirulina sp. CCY15215]|uniref:hypothetical protein n=1 Tax=Spirulina sp. CCY15215 TaxID=2767591 RepID=UPI00194DE657|nr:hypothetical protein [Spirulina major]